MSYFSCCVGNINYHLDDLDETSQILPKKQSINDKIELYPENNLLFSYGYNTYGNIIDLNKLTNESKTILNVKQMCFGENHTLMLIESLEDDIIKDTFLYGCGSNSNGQLGLKYIPGNQNEYENFEEINLSDYINEGLFFWNKIKFIIDLICVGNDYSLVLIKYPNSENSTLYRFEVSKNDKYSKENEKRNTINKEKYNTSAFGKILKIKAFNDKIIILTSLNYLLLKGINFDMEYYKDYKIIYTLKEKIKEISLGINSCLLLTETNHILCFGHNEYNEFGLQENKDNLMVKGKYLVNDFFYKKGLKAIKISSGARHTLILFDNGEVYCFGDNSDKQCIGFSNYVNEPVKVIFDDDCKIIDIECGFNHSIAKSNTGKIYVWGDSSYGKCGYKENRVDNFIPTEISELKIRNVVKIFAGPYQSAFFTSGGVVQ